MHFPPGSDTAAGIVKSVHRMLITLEIQKSQIPGNSKEKPKFLNAQVGPHEMTRPALRIGCLNQCFEYVYGRALDTVA